MITEKMMCLVVCLLLVFGCASSNPDRIVVYRNLRVVPSAVRTICIQPDPAQPEMALIVKPLEEKLANRSYKIVPTPEEAAHTIRLHINLFGTFLTHSEAMRAADSSFQRSTGAPVIGSAAGTAIGGAASGSALHAATTTGGGVGGIVGEVVGSILSVESKGPLFYAAVDVRISDPVSGEQHTVRGNQWRFLIDPNNPEVYQAMQRQAADDLSNKIAELMP